LESVLESHSVARKTKGTRYETVTDGLTEKEHLAVNSETLFRTKKTLTNWLTACASARMTEMAYLTLRIRRLYRLCGVNAYRQTIIGGFSGCQLMDNRNSSR
jgi:hypothetical protein